MLHVEQNAAAAAGMQVGFSAADFVASYQVGKGGQRRECWGWLGREQAHAGLHPRRLSAVHLLLNPPFLPLPRSPWLWTAPTMRVMIEVPRMRPLQQGAAGQAAVGRPVGGGDGAQRGMRGRGPS